MTSRQLILEPESNEVAYKIPTDEANHPLAPKGENDDLHENIDHPLNLSLMNEEHKASEEPRLNLVPGAGSPSEEVKSPAQRSVNHEESKEHPREPSTDGLAVNVIQVEPRLQTKPAAENDISSITNEEIKLKLPEDTNPNTKFEERKAEELLAIPTESHEALSDEDEVVRGTDSNMLEIDPSAQSEVTNTKLQQLKFAADAENGLSHERMCFVTTRVHPYVIRRTGSLICPRS